jgi:adenylyltransferase/sulfurtransferase
MTANGKNNKPEQQAFSGSEWLRYTRHIQLPQIGAQGQQALKQSHVVVIGCGGLGSPVLLYLAAAGIGQITLVDGDTVDLTNLQRQILFGMDDITQPKATAAKQRLSQLNPEITLDAVNEPLSLNNAESLIAPADLVLDCTDNFATRYLINDVCATLKKPWVFASIHQFSGQCALFTPGDGHACFRCLFPEMPTGVADCNTAGVLGVLPGMLGMFQANEAIKFLAGLPTPLNNKLLLVEAIDLTFRQIQLTQSSYCIVCQQHKSADELADFYSAVCASNESDPLEVSADYFESIKNNEEVLLLDVRTHAERSAFHMDGIHIPLSDLEGTISKLSKNKTIVCYCQSGTRSLKAAKQLKRLGFTCHSLKGGLATWLKSVR